MNPKSDDTRQRIELRLNQAFMFNALDDKERQTVIDAMVECTFKAAEDVIKQDEDGDVLYVVDSGELDCHKRFEDGGEDKYLKTYVKGESFGELALLYNAPRAASIKAKTDSVLFSLDRETFNHIVKDAHRKKREQYHDFLGKVEVLSGLDSYERDQIADALKRTTVEEGQNLFKEGETGNEFYLLLEGEAQAHKNIEGGNLPFLT